MMDQGSGSFFIQGYCYQGCWLCAHSHTFKTSCTAGRESVIIRGCLVDKNIVYFCLRMRIKKLPENWYGAAIAVLAIPDPTALITMNVALSKIE